MRLHSTAVSIEQGEITLVAIIECIISISIYLMIALYFETIVHMAAAVVLAPLFLLRTERSISLGLHKWDGVLNGVRRIRHVWIHLLCIILAPVLAVAIRIYATAATSLSSPRETLKSVPSNWVRHSLCTDLFFPPEMIPGEYYRPDFPQFQDISASWQLVWRSVTNIREFLINSIIFFGVLGIGYIPAVAIRISFKASSPVYLPFIWVARTTVGTPSQLRFRLERYTKGEFEKARRWIAGIVLVLLASKLAMVEGLVERDYIKSKLGSERLAEILLAGFPWWHLALAFDAIVTFLLFYYADSVLAKLEKSLSVWTDLHNAVISTGSFLRALVAVVGVIYGFVVAFAALVHQSS